MNFFLKETYAFCETTMKFSILIFDILKATSTINEGLFPSVVEIKIAFPFILLVLKAALKHYVSACSRTRTWTWNANLSEACEQHLFDIHLFLECMHCIYTSFQMGDYLPTAPSIKSFIAYAYWFKHKS